MTTLPVKNALAHLIYGNDNFCYLCFQTVSETASGAKDVFIDENEGYEKLSDMLMYLLGKEVAESVSAFGRICPACQVSCTISYNFIKMCKQNYEDLVKTLGSVSESFHNTINDIENYNNLYIYVDTKDFVAKQYYDDRKVHSTKVSARFNQISQRKFRNYKPEDTIIRISSIYSGKRCGIKSERVIYDIPTIATCELIKADPHCPEYICKECYTVFTKESKLRHHYFKFHYPRKYKCCKCVQSFITKDLLTRHESQYHKSVCKECGKYFCNKYVLRKHEMSHSLKIMCPTCGRVYRSIEAYNKHKKDNVCEQKSKKLSSEGQFQCDICKKTYCTKAYIAKHIKYEHSDAEGFRCQFCSKQYYAKSRLETHLVKHTQEKKFVCDICNGKFGTKMALVYHRRLHTGERPYKCDHCDGTFISASRRLDHMRRHHLMPGLECNICHSKFKATGSLLKHKKRHFNPNSRLSKIMEEQYS